MSTTPTAPVVAIDPAIITQHGDRITALETAAGTVTEQLDQTLQAIEGKVEAIAKPILEILVSNYLQSIETRIGALEKAASGQTPQAENPTPQPSGAPTETRLQRVEELLKAKLGLHSL